MCIDFITRFPPPPIRLVVLRHCCFHLDDDEEKLIICLPRKNWIVWPISPPLCCPRLVYIINVAAALAMRKALLCRLSLAPPVKFARPLGFSIVPATWKKQFQSRSLARECSKSWQISSHSAATLLVEY